VTSTAGNGNFATWPGASGVGAAAADSICAARATAVGLPGTYVAWVSTSSDDAYCRVHGLTGKRSGLNPCGGTLPTGAGPWVLTDAPQPTPFALTTPELVLPALAVLNPPRRNENGAVVHGGIWTGSDSSGAAIEVAPSIIGDCGGWTSSSGNGEIGSTDETGWGWGSNGTAPCASNVYHLLCLEVGTGGDPLPTRAGGARLAFVTSKSGKGDLSTWADSGAQSGLPGADAVCRKLALDGNLPYPNSFKAWLSTQATDAIDRFAIEGEWMRLDRVRVASSIAELIGGTLASPINMTEQRVYLGNHGAWTGTMNNGTALLPQCGEWDSQAGTGVYGSVQDTVAWSRNFDLASCDTGFHMYCLQDLPFTFYDGFEWGDTTGWPAADGLP